MNRGTEAHRSPVCSWNPWSGRDLSAWDRAESNREGSVLPETHSQAELAASGLRKGEATGLPVLLCFCLVWALGKFLNHLVKPRGLSRDRKEIRVLQGSQGSGSTPFLCLFLASTLHILASAFSNAPTPQHWDNNAAPLRLAVEIK